VAMDAWNAIEDGKVDISALQARPATLF
jgi:hypothetical protein